MPSPTCPCCGYYCEFPRLCDVCAEEEHDTPCCVIPSEGGADAGV